MATPTSKEIKAYKGNDLSIVWTFTDANDDTAIDINAVYDEIDFKIFKFNSEANPEFSDSLSGTLSVTSTNQLTASLTDTEVDDLRGKDLYYKLVVTIGTIEKTFIVGDFNVYDYKEGAQTDSGFTLSIDDSTVVTNIQTSGLYAESVQAVTDAQAAQTAAETAESNAQSSAASASNSASSASTSASNASDDADDAEKQAQNTTSFTDSNSVTFDKGAKGYAQDAESARDEIQGKIDFTGQSENDIYRVDSLGVAQPVNQTDFLQSKVPFKKSPIGENTNQLFAWDNFNRTASTLGTADSGQAWQNLIGDGYSTNGGSAYGNSAGNISYLDRGTIPNDQMATGRGQGAVKIEAYGAQTTTSSIGLVIANDVDNYVYGESVSGNGINIYKVVSGVETQMGSLLYNLGGVFNSGRGSNHKMEFTFRSARSSGTATLLFRLPEIDTQLVVDASDLLSTVFNEYTDINKVGIYSSGFNIFRYFTQFKAYNLCR